MYRRLIHVVAIGILVYASVILVTGGFDVLLGPMRLRSHETGWLFTVAAMMLGVDLLWNQRTIAAGSGFFRLIRVRRAGFLRTTAYAGALVAIAWLSLLGLTHIIEKMPEETPSTDFALIEIYTLRSLHNEQLVGPYSRLHWRHPGPAMFYVLRPLYQLSDRRFESLRWSALLLNLACLAAILGIARRRGGPALVIGLSLAIGIHLVRVPDQLASPWNPELLALPLALLLAACAAVVDGDHRFLVVVAATASFLIQTHIAVAPTAVVVSLVACAWLIARPVRDGKRWMSVNAAIWTTVALWILPLSQELASPGRGNLTAIYESFVHNPWPAPSARQSYAAFLEVLSRFLMPGFTKAGLPALPNLRATGFIISLGTLLALPWAAIRFAKERRRFSAALTGLSFVASLTALWSLLRIQGDIFDHLIFWVSILGAVNSACVGVALALWLSTRLRASPARPPWLRFTAAAMTVGCVSLAAATGVRQLYKSHQLVLENPATERIRRGAEAIENYLAERQLRRPFVRIEHAAWYEAAGIVLALYKSGWELSIEPDWISMFGESFAPVGNEDCEVVIDIDAKSPSPDVPHVLLAQWPELSIRAAPLSLQR